MKFKLIEDKNEKRYSIQSIDAWNSKEEIEATDDFVEALYKTFETFEPEDYEETVIIKDNIDNKYMDFDELEDAAKDYFNSLRRKQQVCAFGRSDYAEMDDLEEILERVFRITFESDYYDEALKQGDDQKASELQSKLDQLDKDWDKADASGQPTKPISDEIEATQKQLDETFEIDPIVNNINIFVKEYPINIDDFKTIEEFEAFIANDLLNKEINALTNEELYAIESVYERLSDAIKEIDYDAVIREIAQDSYETGNVYDHDDFEEFKKIMIEDYPQLANNDALIDNLWTQYWDEIEEIREKDNIDLTQVVYHGTKTNPEPILKDGFKGESVFFSDDKYDAEGYGGYIVGVKDINSLSLYELSKDELLNINEVIENIKSTGNYSGVKYRYSEDRPYNYQIFDIVNLNKLERFDANIGESYRESVNQLRDMADEAKKKQKGLGAFVKLDAGDVEHNVAAFNNATTINSGESAMSESAENKEINIRQKLIEKDIANGDGFGTLTNLYDTVEYKLTLDDKKQLIDYIIINNYNAIERFLESKLIDIDGQFDLED